MRLRGVVTYLRSTRSANAEGSKPKDFEKSTNHLGRKNDGFFMGQRGRANLLRYVGGRGEAVADADRIVRVVNP